MNVKEIAEKLNLKVLSGASGLSNEISFGYASDLLSDVMGNAKSGEVWITLQTHKNVMAIASLKDLAAVILVSGLQPESDMAAQSDEEGIPVLSSSEDAFTLIGKLYELLKK
ncbi:MAG: serine kinase [Lentimicrobium sp.]|jgi:predicted transcriptional regulator|nr:serine kinase [Lentimicrobium sp.]MDD2526526.1 DRTGG domain-containing protein [Lentimicrobiaceae bacterium]MDD4596340.1 DRTGG domain-containing protein [Lentimicrobiaceae bacterium]MDY0025537.1 DRTGG domain-containing protein [Lentimicrobium sp.]